MQPVSAVVYRDSQGSWVGIVWGVSDRDQEQQQSWQELAGAGSHMHGVALHGHAPSVFFP